MLENTHESINVPDIKLIEIHEFCSLGNALTKAGSSLSQGFKGIINNKFELKTVKSQLKPFWFIEIDHIIEYPEEKSFSINLPNQHTESVTIDGKQYSVIDKGSYKSFEITTQNSCVYRNNISAIFDASTGVKITDDGEYRHYVERQSHWHQEKTAELDTEDKPDYHINLEEIDKAQSYIKNKVLHELYEKETQSIEDSLRMKATHNEKNFTRFELYFHPIFLFEYYNENKKETKFIVIDGVTGKVIKENILESTRKFFRMHKEPIVEITAEISGAFIPGTSYVIRELGKRL